MGGTSQAVRNPIRAFNQRGLVAHEEGSHRAHSRKPAFDPAGREALNDPAHHSPRRFGHPTSLCTLDLLAQESFRQALCEEQVSGQIIPRSLQRLDLPGKRAKRWLTSPDSGYPLAGDARKRVGRPSDPGGGGTC